MPIPPAVPAVILAEPSPARPQGICGRGASCNPQNRFEPYRHDADEEWTAAEDPAPGTLILVDRSQSLITRNDSPDLPFSASLNPYRGCEHGCIYCYARPTPEYLGFSAGLDFESRILAKPDAARLLREELSAPGWTPQLLAMSGVTDCYQPVERRLRLTRACLAVLAELRHPVAIITKSQLVTRDLDLLGELARHRACSVTISLTTLDQELSLAMEPRAPVPTARLEAMRALAQAGVPVGISIAPVIPGLTDHEIPALVRAAAAAGAGFAHHTPVRLPLGVAELFSQWLAEHRPLSRSKVLNRIRQLRGGRLNDPRFGTRMQGEGVFAEQMHDLVACSLRRHGLADQAPELSLSAFRRPLGTQLSWFDP